MVLVVVMILQVVEGMMVMIPGTDHHSRIHFTIQVLEAIKSWCNMMGNDPLEMMCSCKLRNWSQM
jgi:hypothetical protein